MEFVSTVLIFAVVFLVVFCGTSFVLFKYGMPKFMRMMDTEIKKVRSENERELNEFRSNYR